MRNTILFLLFLSPAFLSKAQECLCLQDSVFYSKIDSIADEIPADYLSDINMFNGTDSLCRIKKYAYIVDKLYERGLDLHSKLSVSYAGARNSDIIMYGPGEQPPPQPVVKVYHKVDLFSLFIEHKRGYERRYYHKNGNKEYIAYVENLVKYGSFTHPQQVRDVLLFKYKALTMEKLYKDLREQRRKPSREERNRSGE